MKTSSVPVSVIILTHRSDERFVRALASAQPAKEVLIVDFNSNNDWHQLQKQFHFKYTNQPTQIRNFSTERNRALQRAHHEWVFFLDSDEVIRGDSWGEIEHIIRSSEFDGVYVRRRDLFHGKMLRHGETGSTWVLRLMKKSASQFTRPVHEIAQVKGKTARSKIVLLHNAHLSLTEFLTDITQYAKLEAEYQTDAKLPLSLLGVKTVLYPKLKFLVNYFLKLGFLDGWRGVAYAVMMSLHSLFVRVFAYENRQ
ncbi:MAG: Glycosyl transferase [Candidatus Pacebacteria bacterium GW2011_GWB1_47_8]|nr:MAG: Glycosyl transferase [Candidatus Pacebacteria bacterium GW2011_GWA1_46_10]KKU84462.1 MAG: Glycosyl transferase [Candidatus Pacebacteria bacterium GW2011_GWB1_47_8]HCR81107.1 hypothetical protein [Candidatus Paceibacterota bacterium]